VDLVETDLQVEVVQEAIAHLVEAAVDLVETDLLLQEGCLLQYLAG